MIHTVLWYTNAGSRSGSYSTEVHFTVLKYFSFFSLVVDDLNRAGEFQGNASNGRRTSDINSSCSGTVGLEG